MGIVGISIVLINKVDTGEVDGFNRPILTETQTIVEDVLVGEPSSDDYVNALNLYGKKAKYTIAIPKGDTNNWEGDVIIWGDRYHIFTKPIRGIEENIPLRWNAKVMVEEYTNGQ